MYRKEHIQGSVLFYVPTGGLGGYSRGRGGTAVMKPPSNPARWAGGHVPGMWALAGRACLLGDLPHALPVASPAVWLFLSLVYTGHWNSSK